MPNPAATLRHAASNVETWMLWRNGPAGVKID